jgi:hypothetical protein
VKFRPLTPDGLADEITERITSAATAPWIRVIIDGPPPARPGDLADALVDRLRVRGRPVVRVHATDYLRPASLRYEHGRTDPEVLYDEWLDIPALLREVFDPTEPGGTGRVLPALWNPSTDRAYRSEYVTVPEGGAIVLDGALLLGRWLPADLTVHLHMSPAALARRTPGSDRWTLPAYTRYEDETQPQQTADLVARVDDPGHPALAVT